MKVVLDTNIIISAFLWQKKSKEIFYLASRNEIKICATQETLDEFERVLRYAKFYSRLKLIDKTPEEISLEFLEIINLYQSKTFCEVIIKDDPSDDIFLACALSAQASFIVSGDKHLLNLKKFQDIPILTPHQFLSQFQKLE